MVRRGAGGGAAGAQGRSVATAYAGAACPDVRSMPTLHGVGVNITIIIYYITVFLQQIRTAGSHHRSEIHFYTPDFKAFRQKRFINRSSSFRVMCEQTNIYRFIIV